MDLYQIFQGGPSDYKWKQLGEYLKGNQLNAGKGIKIENSTSSGSIISAKQPRDIRQSQAPPFSVLSLRQTTSNTYAVEIQEGWVIQRKTGTGSSIDAVDFHEVYYGNGNAMSVRPRTEIAIQNNQFVYVHYKTDEEGFIKPEENNRPTLMVASSVPNSVHHQPPSGEADSSTHGADGNYNVKLFKLTIDNGLPKIIVHQQSDIEHTRLPSFKNVGGQRFIHKDWDGVEDRYLFRTLKQTTPSGRTYGKVIVDAVGTEMANVNDSIKFSAIAEKLPTSNPTTNPQINVNDDGAGIVTIEGNGVNGSLKLRECPVSGGSSPTTLVLLEWEDGLIKGPASDTIISIPSCGSG